MIELKTKLQLADEDLNYGSLYYTVFPVPRSSVATLLEREHNATRVLVKVNGRGNLSAGLMPDGKGDFFITVSKEVRKKFNLEEGQAVVLQISPDDSEYGMPLPEEVAELWAMDEEAYTVFHTLTPGKQRGLLYVIGKPKRPETRVKKAVQIFEYLKSVGGELDYRELNAYMKEDNERW